MEIFLFLYKMSKHLRRVSLHPQWRMYSTQQVLLKSRPLANCPVTTENFVVENSASIVPRENEYEFRTLFLSVDPYMRCRFNEDTGVDYTKPYEIDEPVSSASISQVIKVPTSSSLFKKDDIVLEFFDSWPWKSTYNTSDSSRLSSLKKVSENFFFFLPVSLTLSTIGQTGVSAFFGLFGELNGQKQFNSIADFKRPNSDDVVIISGAAGAVGLAVGQLAKLKGAKVFGVCGQDEKGLKLVEDYGFDGYVNYKSQSLETDLESVLSGKKASIYFDNVGGKLSDLVVSKFMRTNSDVIICGQIDMYDTDENYPPPLGKKAENVRQKLTIKRERYLVFNYEKYFNSAIEELARLVFIGKLKAPETIYHGLNQAPAAFCDMMKGGNFGKMIVQCVQDRDLPLKLRLGKFLQEIVLKNIPAKPKEMIYTFFK
eukprot:maker-scaffold_18-snap-gene-4.44-mRNA-1 protein AED:0.01 eAED:0.01 QI:61/1/1/1/1/1/2/170/427